MERFFQDDGKAVYYGRQLEVALEKTFYHWITKKALNELAASGKIAFETDEVREYSPHFYWPVRHRYPRRQIAEILGLVGEFSEPGFTHAVGHHGEMLTDIAFANMGFRVLARKVQAVDDRTWTESGHDLDRLIVRDGVRYGVEIKNTLAYVDQKELGIKLRMCGHFGVRPLIICRMLPSSYIYRINWSGGFALLFGAQQYPLMAGDLAGRVRGCLGFPVECGVGLGEAAEARLLNWHEGSLVGA
jgi:hypothetical protein